MEEEYVKLLQTVTQYTGKGEVPIGRAVTSTSTSSGQVSTGVNVEGKGQSLSSAQSYKQTILSGKVVAETLPHTHLF